MYENNICVLQNGRNLLVKADTNVKELTLSIAGGASGTYRNHKHLLAGIPVQSKKQSYRLSLNVNKGIFSHSNMNYHIYVNQYDNKYSIELKKFGIMYTNIQEVSIYKQKFICKTLESLFSAFPEMRDCIRTLWIKPLDRYSGTHEIMYTVDGIYSGITLSEKATSRLSDDSTLLYVIVHEFAHALNFYLAYKALNVQYGEKRYQYVDKIRETGENIANTICKNSLRKENLGVEDISEYVSSIAMKNFKECFAETFAEAICLGKRNDLIDTIKNDFIKYSRHSNSYDLRMIANI